MRNEMCAVPVSSTRCSATHSSVMESPLDTVFDYKVDKSSPQRSLRRHPPTSFRYERARRVRTVPSVSVPAPASGGKSGVKGAVSMSAKLLFVSFAVLLGGLWFSIASVVGDPQSTVPSSLTTVSVSTGDTLSSIARDHAPNANRSAVIGSIQELNDLDSAAVVPGQILVVPTDK